MKEGIMNEALAEVNKWVKEYMSYITTEYGNVRPFNTEITPPVDKLYIYDKLNLPENTGIKQQLIVQHGYETYAELEMIALKNREARGL